MRDRRAATPIPLLTRVSLKNLAYPSDWTL